MLNRIIHNKCLNMLELQSKKGKLNGEREKVFTFLSDFRNFQNMLPEGIISDPEINSDSCRFGISGIGRVGLVINDKIPYSQIIIKGTGDTPADFTLEANLEENAGDGSIISFRLNAGLNMMLEMVARKPLQQFIDMLVEKLQQKNFND